MTCKQDSSDLVQLARIARMSGTGTFESRPLVILGDSPSHKKSGMRPTTIGKRCSTWPYA